LVLANQPKEKSVEETKKAGFGKLCKDIKNIKV
jgi:hypothetical protein